VTTTNTTQNAIDRLWAEIDRREDELIETVAALVRYPSELGNEAEAQAYVADHLRQSGLEVDVWDLDDAIKEFRNAGDSGVPFIGRPNVAGTMRGSGGGRSFILNGHIDVVSPEPVAAWSYHPWQPTIVGDRMYGRGAYDMKSGDALNLMLPRLLRDLGIELRGDLIIHSVIEEECTGNGALDAARRYRADAALMTEPTGGLFTHAHVGVLWFRIGIVGKSWHAMQAWKGVNAITKAIPIMQSLQSLDARLNEQTHPAFAGIEHPINLNIASFRAATGQAPSPVPASSIAASVATPARPSPRPAARSRRRLPAPSPATPGSPSTRQRSSGMASRAPARSSPWTSRSYGCSTSGISASSARRWTSRLAPASTTCAITTSRASPPAATAPPGPTATPPTSGSTPARCLPRRRCWEHF
jgi:acetylornithine deacetylase/succinyl-diaminopimelate desuccinylase-like protein